MNLKKISFGNFKSLYNASFEPGKINVFIGANGSGKSTTSKNGQVWISFPKFTQNIHIYVIGPSLHQSTIEVSALYPTLYSLKGNPTCEHVTQAGFFFLLE